jgi:formyl-CoA transferase
VRILEATTTWAGPMCGRILGDFGAEVIKVEALEGEVGRSVQPNLPGTDPPVSFMHATVNCNKRSLSLDLRLDAGRDLFLKLAERCDIVLENFRPGTMERLGVGYRDVARVRPDVVYVSISGFGQFGPQSDRLGYDPLAQAASGWLSLNGDPAGEPTKAPTFLADDLGGVHGALAAMAALRHRDRHGEGQHVDVSLLDSMWFQSSGFLTLGAMGLDLPRLGNEYRVAAPARVYDCKDGKINAGVLLDRHWKKLAEVIGRPELADDPRFAEREARLAHRKEVDQLVADWMVGRTVAEAFDAMSRAALPAEPVRSYAEAARDPHARERDMPQDVVQSEGTPVPLTGPAAKLSRTPIKVRSAAPALGADTRAILAEIGLDDKAVADLRERGVVGPEPTRR